MPVYNGSGFLKEAIESILSQTYASFEFIIINDGSTDATENIILSYSDHRIVYLKNEKNEGLIYSLNNGIRRAKGGYIARMDADDVALPTRLQEQVAVFKNDAAVVATGSDFFVLNNGSLTRIKNSNSSDYIKTCLMFAPYFNHPTMMIKNIFSERKIFYDKDAIHAEDYKLWTELAFEGKFGYVDQPLLKYRSHGAQISANYKSTQLSVSVNIRKPYLERLGFHFSEEEFSVHNIIGNNVFIQSKEILIQAESWLQSLVKQNSVIQKINEADFNSAIHKFWLDSCGYTNLGIAAYKLYMGSSLSQYSSNSFADRSRLFIKCLVRKFR